MRPPTALFLGTHPDDVAFFVGGTVRRHVELGYTVTEVVAATGECNRFLKRYHPTRALERQEEGRRAGAILGIHRIRFLRLLNPDERIVPDAVSQLVHVLRSLRPDKVFAPPFRHQIERWIHDHQEVAWLTREAMRRSGILAEYFLYGSYRPTKFYNVTNQKPLVDRALKEHRTQAFNLAPSVPVRTAVLRYWGWRRGVRYAEGVEEVGSRD